MAWTKDSAQNLPTLGCGQQEGGFGTEEEINISSVLPLPSGLVAEDSKAADLTSKLTAWGSQSCRMLGALGKVWRLWEGQCQPGGPRQPPPPWALRWGAAAHPQQSLPRGLLGGACPVVSGAEAWPGRGGWCRAAGRGPKAAGIPWHRRSGLLCISVSFRTVTCSGRGGWNSVLAVLAQ